MSEKRKRTEVLAVRLLPSEAALIREMAQLHGVSTSAYIRAALGFSRAGT